ncbi:uncharacterized protein [Pyrus communis]|uniref:uncharacterized protein n=1 Tax=Pyrus communis TaxID=23211 RepID=UPI0035C134F8
MEEDDDEYHRRQRASHSRCVMEAMSLLPEQKVIAALRMLAYEASAYQVDGITRMGKSTVLESLVRFCFAIEALYTKEYLWKLTPMDLRRLLRKGEMRGFPGMIGSIDRMHWTLKNCPSAWSAAKMFDVEALRSIMMTCIILHNMIVEDEYDYDAVDEYELDTMNNLRTRIYCAHDGTEDLVQHKPLERDGCYN